MVRTRIAPSPTGIPHIGNTRTALFNFLFAKHNNGKFILRIEDTDRKRLVEGTEEGIYEILEWLGFDVDEKYKQSERLSIHKEHSQELLKKSLAFEDDGAIRFRTPKDGETSWIDAIGNKEITFQNSTQEDFVILKSDGFPTYNFANVVDDHLLEITHVIRGDEFISSTPKHIMLYKAFGWEPPTFAHLPLILGPDKTKLSKRHGAKSVLELRSEGFLKEAIINFMALLGWTPPAGKEILSLDEMIEKFELKDINLASPIFDIQKLTWMNGEYIRQLEVAELNEKLKMRSAKLKNFDDSYLNAIIPKIQERIKTLKEFDSLAGFFFDEPEVDKKLFDSNADKHLEAAMQVVQNCDWDVEKLQKAFLDAISENKFNTGEFFMTLRIAIAGSRVTPPIVDSIIILRKQKTLERLEKAIKLL